MPKRPIFVAMNACAGARGGAAGPKQQQLGEPVGSGSWLKDLEDPRRTQPAKDGIGEREMLEACLEFHRTTLRLKCEGLDDHARKARPVATSKLSLHRLVRHMAEVERS